MINRVKVNLRRPVVGLLVLGVTAGAASSAAARVVHGSQGTEAREQVAVFAAPAKVTGLTAAQQSIGVLRGTPLAATDRMPAKAQAAISATSLSGENPALGRKALVTPYGDNVYISPAATDQICVDFADGDTPLGGSCAPVALASQGGFNGATACVAGTPADDFVEFGLLPDGANDPRFVLSDGTYQPIAVVNNVYVVEEPRSVQPTMIRWTENGVEHSAQLTPSTALQSARCAS